MWPPLAFIGTQNCILSCSVCVFAVRVRPLSCSVLPQNCTLSCSVCFCFFCCQPHTRPRVSEKQKQASPKASIVLAPPRPSDFIVRYIVTMQLTRKLGLLSDDVSCTGYWLSRERQCKTSATISLGRSQRISSFLTTGIVQDISAAKRRQVVQQAS